MKEIFKRPKSLTDKEFHFCPGCHHGIIHRLVAECLDHFKLREETIGVASVGCSVFLYDYFDVDVIEAPHGRAAAVATGVKRAMPDSFVFTYQGDGDLAAIGTAEIVHAANRGENITVIFVNNAVFGMTGGQMAPTTLIDQETTTTPFGRNASMSGYPIRMAEMLSTLLGATFVARVSVHSPRQVRRAKEVLMEAFKVQIEKRGFSFVEFLSACPTNWKMSPKEAIRRVKDVMIPFYPLGIYKGGEGVL